MLHQSYYFGKKHRYLLCLVPSCVLYGLWRKASGWICCSLLRLEVVYLQNIIKTGMK